MGKVFYGGGKPVMKRPSVDIQASELAVGSTVKLMFTAAETDFIVVHKGKPSSIYDDSCDGLWLLMKNVYQERQLNSNGTNYYHSSELNTWLNGDFLDLFDAAVKNAVKQVKIPCRMFSGRNLADLSGANGLSTKVFVLSCYELGWTKDNNDYLPLDGAKLDYFDAGTGSSANQKRIALYDGVANRHWTRSLYASGNDKYHIWNVWANGTYGTATGSGEGYYGVRPALILPHNTIFDSNTLVCKGVG